MAPPSIVRRGRRAWALVLAAVLVLAACTADQPATPEEALLASVRDTLRGSHAYTVVIEADREALDALDVDTSGVAARLDVLAVSGIVDGDVHVTDVSLLGGDPVLQLWRRGDEQTHVRLRLDDGPLASWGSAEREARLLALAVQTEQPPSVVEAIHAVFASEWILVEGSFDPADLATSPDGEGSDEPDAHAALLDHLEVVDTEQRGDEQVTTVRLRVHDLLRTLGSGGLGAAGITAERFDEGLRLLPTEVTAEVVTVDGLVQEVTADLAAAARADGQDTPGSLLLRAEVTDHGDARVPPPPAPAVTVTSDDLADGLRRLQDPASRSGPADEGTTGAP